MVTITLATTFAMGVILGVWNYASVMLDVIAGTRAVEIQKAFLMRMWTFFVMLGFVAYVGWNYHLLMAFLAGAFITWNFLCFPLIASLRQVEILEEEEMLDSLKKILKQKE